MRAEQHRGFGGPTIGGKDSGALQELAYSPNQLAVD
jgi:hypothetical protein